MTHTLVTFLGKGRDNLKTGYRTARYRFPDRTVRESAFFGRALAEQLAPERLVMLGTSGSMWGVFVENLVAEGEEEEARLQLLYAESSDSVEQPLLDRLVPLMSRAAGRTVVARLIPYGKDEAEQRAILEAVSEAVPSGEVSFDLTHAFRHLGMLGLISSFLLERVGKLKLKGLWYGALDMTGKDDGLTPVLRLDGLMAIQRWVDALDRYDATGDYGVFAPLLEADGVPADKARCLKEAAFHERTFNIADARRKLMTFLPALDAPLPGASGLFQKKLAERLRWVREEQLHEHQRKLAYVYLNRGDYVRAAVLAWEAVITRQCVENGLDPHDYSEEGDRSQAEAKLRDSLEEQGIRWADSPHFRLKNLRNALAHGSPPWARHLRKALSSAEGLHKVLKAEFKHTLG